MATKKYSEYLQINPEFESVLDIGADGRNKNLWREYIVGDEMVTLVDDLCQTIGYETKDSRRSLWIHGSYGTGKSYAALVLKHLMEEPPDVVDAYLQNSQKLAQFRNRLVSCRRRGEYLVIWKTGCAARTADQLLLEIESAVRGALKERFGDRADYGVVSLQSSIRALLHNKNINWKNVVETTTLSENYADEEALTDAVESGDMNALKRVAEVIRENRWGMVDSFETFKAWIAEVIEANHLEKGGIFLIWDEFTQYVRYSNDHTILQQLSEFCKEKPFFLCFVVHRSTEWISQMGEDTYQLISHRFHQVEFRLSQDAAYDLIAGSVSIRNGMNEYWNEARRDPLGAIRSALPDMIGLNDKLAAQIPALCPMHPMTIRLLSVVAENFAAAERTMFRFMKDTSNDKIGFRAYIDRYGPQDQACWLTPDWLWDYFFTQESDFNGKDSKTPEYIRHYEENHHLVANDATAERIFKIAMLLMAVMTTTSGMTGVRSRNGLAATVDCLCNCLGGVVSRPQVEEYLATMESSKILLCDEGANGVKRLQLPFRLGGNDEFEVRYKEKAKQLTRYQIFSKNGALAAAFENQAWDANDATFRRMKIVVCTSETTSLKARLKEVSDDLEKNPYKLGLVYVTVANEAEANLAVRNLKTQAASEGGRIIFALVHTPFTEELYKQWLTAIVKADMARESGHSADGNRYDGEANTVVSRWVGTAAGGKLSGWCGEAKEWPNLFGTAQLRAHVRKFVLEELFPYAPESISPTNTAYKACNDGAPLAGIQRVSKVAQVSGTLNELKTLGVLEERDLVKVMELSGSKKADAVANLARFVREKMESGSRVEMSKLWDELQQPPFGYYNTIVCGVMLGFVFSFYQNSAFSWIDSQQGSFVLNENNLKTLVLRTCRGEVSSDYLSAGTLTWQHFRNYLRKIFVLDEGQTANETEGKRSVRERITKVGAPFWALKSVPEESFGGTESKAAACKIVDAMQDFITSDGNTDDAMNSVLQLFNGQGRLRDRIMRAYQDQNVMAAALRGFLFEASPELKEITEKLSVQPIDLTDKIAGAMQASVYTWTEDQVREKLPGVVSEYRYLDALNTSLRKDYRTQGAAARDLRNAFNHMRVAILAVEPLNLPWYKALTILRKVSLDENSVSHMSQEERAADIDELNAHGTAAWECVQDVRPVLATILEQHGIDCTPQELETIYNGLEDGACDASGNQFEKNLKEQTARIDRERNRDALLEMWKNVSGTESVRSWCNERGIPLLWIVPRGSEKTIATLMSVQNHERTLDTDVERALQDLGAMDRALLTDPTRAEQAFTEFIGAEYREIYEEKKQEILTHLKLKLGNDVSSWSLSDSGEFRRELKEANAEKARKEKLDGARQKVRTMQENVLRDKVAAFLAAHPEFCDDFN